MVAEIIEWSPNKLGFRHVICAAGRCHGESFYIKTTDDDKFYSIICVKCGNEVFCKLEPVFGPGE